MTSSAPPATPPDVDWICGESRITMANLGGANRYGRPRKCGPDIQAMMHVYNVRGAIRHIDKEFEHHWRPKHWYQGMVSITPDNTDDHILKSLRQCFDEEDPKEMVTLLRELLERTLEVMDNRVHWIDLDRHPKEYPEFEHAIRYMQRDVNKRRRARPRGSPTGDHMTEEQPPSYVPTRAQPPVESAPVPALVQASVPERPPTAPVTAATPAIPHSPINTQATPEAPSPVAAALPISDDTLPPYTAERRQSPPITDEAFTARIAALQAELVTTNRACEEAREAAEAAQMAAAQAITRLEVVMRLTAIERRAELAEGDSRRKSWQIWKRA
ncbi:hypothetical protein Q8F55_008247 [Vanrija albida]|uniref:Uncharacterized protein n=1 Tax=Vanrija albida TaxID=181172 RepID=A0ABR3PVR5_9TREE